MKAKSCVSTIIFFSSFLIQGIRCTSTISLSLVSPSLTKVHTYNKKKQQKKQHEIISNILSLRGGDLGPLSSTTTAKAFTILPLLDGIISATIPINKWADDNTVTRGSLAEHYVTNEISSSAFHLAITSFLTLFQKISLQDAIAYGFLARLVFLTKFIGAEKYKHLGMGVLPFVSCWFLILVTSYALLSGVGHCINMAKMLSVIMAGNGLLMFLDPSDVLLKRFDADETTYAAVRINGIYTFASALYTALLTFGVDPVKSMGYTALAFLPAFPFLEQLVGTHKKMFLGAISVPLVVNAAMVLVISMAGIILMD